MNTPSGIEYDHLTGLYSRWKCSIELQKILDSGRPRVYGCLDLDDFKRINRNYGNNKGDELLKAIANALLKSYQDSLIFRLSGDEFAFILPEMPYNKQEMCLMTRRVFSNLHEIKVEGLENERYAFSLGSVLIDSSLHHSPDEIFFEGMSHRHEAKKHEGNYLYTAYGSTPDIEGCFIALKEDRILYNAINNRLSSIHDESDWLSYLKEGSEHKENMCIRNQGHLEDILNYYKMGALPEVEYDLLFDMIVNYVKWLDAFMLVMLIETILIPHYESLNLTEKIRSYLGHLYLLQADALISVYRMGDTSQHNRIDILLDKCCYITRGLSHDSIRFEPYFFALCEKVGHFESFGKLSESMYEYDKAYEEMRELLLGEDPIFFQDQLVVKHFEYLINNARLFPLYRICYLLVKRNELSKREIKEYNDRIAYIKAHLDAEGIYDMAGSDPEIRRMACLLQNIILEEQTPDEILNILMTSLHKIHEIEYGTLSESNLIIVTYLFLGASQTLLLSQLPLEEKRKIAVTGTSFLLEILRKRESLATDSQVLFLIQVLMRAMLHTPLLTSAEKYNFLLEMMSAVMIDAYGHSKAVATYANIILENIIDNYPQLLVGEDRPYDNIEELKVNRQELLKFMECACMLHDIGKMNITQITTNAFRKLTDNEFSLIRRHPHGGVAILDADPAFAIFKPFVFCHHRWWNEEAGYPSKLPHEERSRFKILIDILSICDSLEAATSRIGRNYRRAKSFLQILDEFCNEAGTRYSQEVVDSIIGNRNTYYAIRQMVDHNWTKIYQHIFQEIFINPSNIDSMIYEESTLPDPYKHNAATEGSVEDSSLLDHLNLPEWLLQMNHEDHLLYTHSLMEFNRFNAESFSNVVFYYHVATDSVDFIYKDLLDGGKVKHYFGSHFSETRMNVVFSEEGYSKAIEVIKRIITEPDFPKEGQQKLEFKDKSRCLLASYTSVLDNEGRVLTIVGRLEDINTTREKFLQTIHHQNKYLQLLDSICDSFVAVVESDIHFEHFNVLKGIPKLNEVIDKMNDTRELAEFVGSKFVDSEYREGFMAFIDPMTILERLKGNNHITYEYHSRFSGWLKAHIIPAEYNDKYEITHLLLMTENIEQEHEKQAFLTYAANYDSLTGLMNRQYGESVIEEEIKKGGPQIFAILDCDRFKMINDQLSHLIGDKVLQGQGNILRKYFANYKCMRLGGDEFVAYINGEDASRLINAINGVKSFFGKITEELKTLRLPELENIAPTMSMGVVYTYSEKDKLTFSQLYQNADMALQTSKRARNGAITVNQLIENKSLYHIF